MRSDENEANVLKLLKKNDVPRKTRSLTVAKETILAGLTKFVSIKELRTQHLQSSQLRIARQIDEDVADMLESLKQKKQPVAGEGSIAAHTKYYDNSKIDNDAILYSSCSNTSEESANETDAAAGYGVFMYNKTTQTPNSTYLDLMSYPVYTDAHTTSVVHNPKGNLEIDKLTISDLKGLGLEKLKLHYKNDVELEYHVDQLKAAVIYLDYLSPLNNLERSIPLGSTSGIRACRETLKGLHKGYKRFQSLLSQLKTPGAGVSTEDARQKFLRVFESDVKGSTGSSSSTQNVAFVSSDNTNSTNKVNTAYGVSTSSCRNSQREGSSSYTNELMYSFFANQSSGPKLDHEDLKQLYEFDLEEIDLKWQVAMISMRLKKFYKKTRRKLHFDAKEPVGFNKNKVECFKCHNTGHFARECRSKGNQESRRRDAGNTGHKARDNGKRPAKQDEPKAMVTIDGEEAVKEKEELKTKLENFQSSSKGLSKPLHSLLSAKDKSGLGYGTQIHEGVLSYENEVLGVPPPMTRIYMPPKSNFEIDESKFTYGLKQSKNSESDAKTSNLASYASNSSVEILEYVPTLVESKPKAISEPKVWSDAPIIEEYGSDSDDENVSKATVEQEIPSCASINTVNHVKSHRQTVKDQDICSLNPKVNKRDWTSLKSKDRIWDMVTLERHVFQATSSSTVRKVTTTRQMVNEIRYTDNLFKSHAPIRRPFNITIAPKANFTNHKVNNAEDKIVSAVGGTREIVVKASADNPHQTLKGKGIVYSGCSRHMTRNKAYLVEYQDFNGGPIAFGGSKGQITGKGKIKTGKLDFDDVYFVKELQHFNLFFVSQICDKKNKVLFTDTECLVLSPNFKLPDENVSLTFSEAGVLHMNWISFGHCAIKKSSARTTHIDVTTDLVRSVVRQSSKPTTIDLTRLRFSRVFFLRTKDETSGILKDFIRQIEKQLNQQVNSIGCDNGTKFKNRDIIKFCASKGIKREYSNARTLQQNGVAERKNRTLIEALVTLENKANKTTDPKEANNSASTQDNCSTTKNGDEKLNDKTSLKTNKEPVDREDQTFLEELEKLKRQEKEANDAAETLRKMFAQDTEDLLLQAGVARASTNNYVNTTSTPVNTASLLRNVNAARPSNPNLLAYANKDDSHIPSLEDIYAVPNDGIFTSASYDAEGAVVDFKNLESLVNVSLIPQSRINSIHSTTQILGDPNSVVQTKSKVNKSLVAHALIEPKKISQDLEDMDVKSAFLYGKIDEEVYVSQPPGFIDPKIQKKKSCCDEFEALMKKRFQMSSMGELTFFLGLQVKQREDGIFISQDKYVVEILKKFDFMSVKTASTLIETKKPLVKDAEAADVDVHLYRSMIGEDKKAKMGLYIKEGNFNKLDDLVGEGADYDVNKGRSINKIKVLNAEAEGVSVASETLNIATLAASIVSVQSVLVPLKLLCLIGSKDR
uniref:Uncharacterized protein n=1 Tax=Tanacetum cinerariifolium TaxID=118510 RepID=A0A6L2L1P7_TANCI|nr:hypothetical protein [Tanacetum cinerariifolium]